MVPVGFRPRSFKCYVLTCAEWQNVGNVSRPPAYRVDLDQSERRSTKVFADLSQNSSHVAINLRPVASVHISDEQLDEFTKP